MRKLVVVFLGIALSFHWAQGQNNLADKVLFTVEDDTVTAGEYMAVYNKNRDVGDDIDPKTPAEYLDLYVNFKLKVYEAMQEGMDTAPNFKYEYQNYYDQLAKPYLSDNDKTADLVREAYERSKQDVRVKHIMVALPEGSRDTAEAYQTIADIRDKIVNQGADFSQLAREYSKDTYSAKKGGDVGYFTVFNMVYPFETAAYETDEGEVSDIIRSQYGYHILKVVDKRPARKKVSVAHIMLSAPEDKPEKSSEAEAKIKELHQKLQDGAAFAELAKQYSDDKSSAQQGGRIQQFGINEMFPAFEEAAYALKEGEISEPVRTKVGWHIIKLLGKQERKSFEESKAQLTNKVKRNTRSQRSQTSIVKKLKKEYGFKEYLPAITTAVGMVDNTYFNKGFKKPQSEKNQELLFEFANQKYFIGDFMDFLEEEQSRVRQKNSLEAAVYRAYDKFTQEKLIEYEKTRLKDKYPEFKHLAREYYEGILLFNITNQKVWQKAIEDTSAVKAYFKDNQDNYMWDRRYDVAIATSPEKKIAKKARKMLKKGKSTTEVKEKLNDNSELNISFKTGVFEKGQSNLMSDYDIKEEGPTNIKELGDNFQFVMVNEILPPQPKTLKEARGALITDYQNKLEQEWLNELQEKYEVNINKEILNKTIEALEAQS